MGINYELALLIAKTFQRHPCGGELLQFGRQTINISDAQFTAVLERTGFLSRGPEGLAFTHDVSDLILGNRYYRTNVSEAGQFINDLVFFRALGFRAFSCDVNNYEDPDFLFDLNGEIPGELKRTFDCLLNGGTFEHVFNPVKAIESAHRLLAVGGVLLHLTPVNGLPNHGYYQISPCLLHEYYEQNGYEVLDSKLMIQEENDWHVADYTFNAAVPRLLPVLHYFAARKKAEWTGHTVPEQSGFAQLWGRGGGQEDMAGYRHRLLVREAIAKHSGRIAIWCGGAYTRSLLQSFPELAGHLRFIVDRGSWRDVPEIAGVRLVSPAQCLEVIGDIDVIFVSTPSSIAVYNDLSQTPALRGKLIML